MLATLEGSEQPDQLVIRGNHHDAWVNGARDPISGLVALMAEAKAVGTLARSGWRPKRSLVFAAWDAEEPGVRDALEQRNWTLATTQIVLAADTVTILAGQIGRATEILLAAR